MNTASMSDVALLATLVGQEMAKALAKQRLTEVFGFNRPKQVELNEDVASYRVHPVLAAAKELFVSCYHCTHRML